MPRKLEAYVEEILRSVAEIESFVVGQDFSTYCDDIKTKAAVERKLLNIGEALNQANRLIKISKLESRIFVRLSVLETFLFMDILELMTLLFGIF